MTELAALFPSSVVKGSCVSLHSKWKDAFYRIVKRNKGTSIFFLPDCRDRADKRQPQNKEETENQRSINERMQSAESWDILASTL